MIWTNFFDDFPQLDLAVMGDGSRRTAENFLELLGWDVSCSEKKAKPFAEEFKPLEL